MPDGPRHHRAGGLLLPGDDVTRPETLAVYLLLTPFGALLTGLSLRIFLWAAGI